MRGLIRAWAGRLLGRRGTDQEDERPEQDGDREQSGEQGQRNLNEKNSLPVKNGFQSANGAETWIDPALAPFACFDVRDERASGRRSVARRNAVAQGELVPLPKRHTQLRPSP